MSLEWRLHDPLGERTLAAQELPLSVGGEGAALAVPGVPRGVVAASIGADSQGPFVEPAPDPDAQRTLSIRLNGRPFTERTALVHGDVLALGDARIFFTADPRQVRLRIEHLKGNETAAPLNLAEAEDEEGSGAGAQSIQRVGFKPRSAPQAGSAHRRPWRWALAAAVAALAMVMYLLMSATPVRVVTEPGGADVNFSGAWFELGFGEHILLRPGAYTLVASNRGFESARMPVTITSKPDQELRVVLKKLPGRVNVDTGGLAATLTVDGKPIGSVPAEYRITAGEHEFVLSADRHLDFTARVAVKGAGERQDLKAQLTPSFSAVTIESKPAGAKVVVDGRELGVTPLTAEIDAGNHSLGLNAQGFRAWESSIQVQANAPQKIGPVELGLPDGRLIVRTSPTQADVAVAGRYRGRAPLELDLAPGVHYEVVATRAGYEPLSRVVPIEAGKRVAVELPLKAILGEVKVSGEPADAVLYVDGAARGPANQTLQLPAAEHQIEVRRDGFQTFTSTVTPQPGFARLIEYRLQTPEQARTARVPPILKSRVAGELKLIPPGRFEMGSPRREPGRRTNEAQRSVVLQRPYYIGIKEVTNAEYRQFQPEHLSGVVRDRSLDQDNHPVVNLTWRDAAEYCNWLSAEEGLPPAYVASSDQLVPVTPATIGYRLPTEAEWEWAARYEAGKAARRYPWGAGLPVAPASGNYADGAALAVLEVALEGYNDSFVTTAPVGSFAPNSLGLYDFGGNVTEWVQDFYTVAPEIVGAAATDPTGPATGRNHVVRGSSWKTANVTELRLAWRDGAEGKAQHIGFRISRYAE